MGHKVAVCENQVLKTAKGVKMSLEDQNKKQRGFKQIIKSTTILSSEKRYEKFLAPCFFNLEVQAQKNFWSQVSKDSPQTFPVSHSFYRPYLPVFSNGSLRV